MKYWPNLVFSFLLSITEVNVNLAVTYFGTNWSDQFSQEIGQDINLQYASQ